MRWLLFVVLVGCYSPASDPACLTMCDPAFAGQPTACPGSLVCMSDGRCHASDGSCGPLTNDSDVLDVRPDDSTSFCYGEGPLRVCLDSEPVGAFSNPTPTINTDACAGVLVDQDDGPQLCVIAHERIVLEDLSVTGMRPLVVIGTASIQLNGTISGASRRNSMTGPGAGGSMCSQQVSMIEGAGGNGGSFGGVGGIGGRGTVAPAGAVQPSVLRGGCPGRPGIGDSVTSPGGAGGGAMYFISKAAIVIDGPVNASGAGGLASGAAGGGGGGSGGMLGFDAPQISVSVTGSAFANGGSGAGGGIGAGDGNDSAGYTDAAPGGAMGTSGSAGGHGALGTAGPGFATGMFGGGGGGGAGIIKIYPATQVAAFGGRISPPPAL